MSSDAQSKAMPSKERQCAQCGATILPAMARCRECGTRCVSETPTPRATRSVAIRHPGQRAQPKPPQIQTESAAGQKHSRKPPAPARPHSPVINPAESDSIPSGVDADSDRISTQCEKCHRAVRAPSSLAGARVRCPKCGHPVDLPQLTEDLADAGSAGHSGSPEHLVRRQLAEAIESGLLAAAKTSEPETIRDKVSKGQSKKLIQAVRRSVDHPGDYRKMTDARAAIHQIIDAGSQMAGEALVEFLPKLADPLRPDTIRALGKLRIRNGYEATLRALLSPTQQEVEAAIRAAGNYGWESSVMSLLLVQCLYPEHRIRVSTSIAKIGEPALSTLLSTLDSSQSDTLRFAALEALKVMKSPKSIEVLISLIQRDRSTMRHLAVEALSQIRAPQTVRPLMKLATDPDAKVRFLAIDGLAETRDPKTVPTFVSALTDTSRDVQLKAIESLGDLGDKSTVAKLAAALTSTDIEIQIAAAEAIGKLGDHRVVPKLLEFLDAQSHEVKDNETLHRLVRILQRLRDPRAVLPLCELLDADDVKLRRRVVEALGTVGDGSARLALERVLQRDHADEVRAAAAKALGDLGDPAAIGALTTALHETSEVRLKALIALSRFKSTNVHPVIRQMLVDPLPQIRYQVAGLLGEIGDAEAISDLEQLVADDDPLVKRAALKSLESLGDQRTEAAIIKACRKSARARRSGSAVSTFASGLFGTIPGGAATIWGSLSVLIIAGLVFGLLGRGGDSEPPPPMVRGYVDAIGVSADAQLLVAARNRGMTEVWDLAAENRLWFTNEIPRGKGVVVSQELNTVMIASSKSAFFYDLDSTGQLTNQVEVPGHESPILNTVSTVDRKYAATMDTTGVVRIWDLSQRQSTAGLSIPPSATAMTIDEAGQVLVAGGSGMGLQAWSLESAEIVFSSDKAGRIPSGAGKVTSISISTDEAYVAVAFSEGLIQVYDFSRQRKLSEVQILNGRPMLAFNKQNELFIVNRKLYRMPDIRTPNLDALGEALTDRSTYDFSPAANQMFLASDEASPIVIVNLTSGTSKNLDVK